MKHSPLLANKNEFNSDPKFNFFRYALYYTRNVEYINYSMLSSINRFYFSISATLLATSLKKYNCVNYNTP